MEDASLIDVQLIIRYEGLKATQYFSKFTPESVNELRKDLADIGLPHPKRENIQLLSHGTVECYWQTSPKNHILLNNLKSRTKPTPEMKDKWKELSIGNVTWKESRALGSEMKKKRPFSQVQPDANTKEKYSFSSGLPLKRRVETPPEGVERHSFGPRHSHDTQDSVMSDSNSTEITGPHRWPAQSSNTEEQVRPFKIQKVNSGSFKLPAKPAFENDNRPSSISRPRNYSGSDGSSRHIAHSGGPVTSHQDWPPPNYSDARSPSWGSPVKIKAEDQVVDDFLKNLPFEPKTLTQDLPSSLRKPMSPPQAKLPEFAPQTSSSNFNRSSASNGIPSARASVFKNPPEIINLEDFDEIPGLSRLKSQKDHTPVIASSVLPTPPPSAPLANNSHSGTNGFLQSDGGRRIPTGPAARLPDARASRAADLPSKGSLNHSGLPTGPAIPVPRNMSQSFTKYRPRSAEPERRPPSRSSFDARPTRFAPLSSSSDDTRRLMRESFDLKREIQALLARHTTVTKQLQGLDSSWVPEPLQIGSDVITTNGNGKIRDFARDADDRLISSLKLKIEDLERDLRKEKTGRDEDWKMIEVERAEARTKLEEERRLRDEAEKALADVRRECQHPFVVPSLLDAFVQVSKLTTRGLKPSPTHTPAPSHSNFDSSPQRHSDVPRADTSLSRSGKSYDETPSTRPHNGTSSPSVHSHAPRNGSYHDRDRRPYNRVEDRMESMSARHAMPPPRVPSPTRSYYQGKTSHRMPLNPDPYAPRRTTVVKAEPQDDIIMF